ncbi:TIGR01457 family HAD-type hydrolase [Fructilactobacillus sanfranciscensis]|uniref:TIGR01457 family HAD-type hydrolase n=1 Tax=Fructilactobacillus sanfranciscensis TaxID=1625 RepID=UPI0006F100CF|nr:TIGR01457 family HAD-type hydrolase [Fructilactobacillus sanfranciscensis]KRM81106.1 protein nagD-like protein [Fructilactobacillus sanfranciscensis DSM 20451]POH24331.1 HAD family hydrolase [Fructilactobacillus sanfranciscensis DSM 20451]QFX94091.1 TIGR01457 family HAD-type hydrolase [Fructilactobacillus sanfranciscensis]RDX59927.1 TIGR01457 family HAD-type hydrolase [Fructilactobacillus sanfranciscensis]
MKKYKGYLIDLDGTIYQGKIKIPAAKRFVERLQKNQIPFLFVTNNTTKQPADVVKNLADNHDIFVNESNVYTSGQATTEYLLNDVVKHGLTKSAYVIGEKGLKQLLTENGFDLYSSNPSYVVVALDRDLTYQKLAQAVLYVNAGIKFIGTNADTLIPSEQGMIPSAGAIIDSVRYATHTNPFIIGKPNDLIVNNAVKRMGLQKDEVVMVGDNYDTDISAGIKAGVDTLLVYSGVSKRDEVAKLPNKPTNEIDNFDEWIL